MLFVAFPLLLLIFFLCIKFLLVSVYVSQHVYPEVYPVRDSLGFLDLGDSFFSHVNFSTLISSNIFSDPFSFSSSGTPVI